MSMNIFERAKVVAEIAELASRIYGLVVDKSRAMFDRDQRIKELERQLAELRARLGGP
jgi:hypothetical protein